MRYMVRYMVRCMVHCMVHCAVHCTVPCTVHCTVHCTVYCTVHYTVHDMARGRLVVGTTSVGVAVGALDRDKADVAEVEDAGEQLEDRNLQPCTYACICLQPVHMPATGAHWPATGAH